MEEKTLLIISLKEGPLKQNKLKDRVGDSLLSAVVIINSNGNDDNNDTILLLVPTAS